MNMHPAQQVPAVYHRRLGDLVITTVSDGYVDLSLEPIRGVSREEAERMMLKSVRRLTPRIAVNSFVVRSSSNVVLIDAGSGTTMGPTCGRLMENLAAAEIKPEDIDTILLTHIHPDHSNGLTDDNGHGLFPNAEIVVHADEIDHWFNDARMAKAAERERIRYFEAARFRLAPYRHRTRTFHTGEVISGITGIPCPGHTPGHVAYRIASGSEALLVWGDTVHIPELQVPRPDITMIFDSDPTAAATSRQTIFEMAITDNLLIGGMHLHFPGFARMVREGATYSMMVEPWSHTV